MKIVKTKFAERFHVGLLWVTLLVVAGCASDTQELSNDRIKVSWTRVGDVWKVADVTLRKDNEWTSLGTPSGEYTLLYSAQKPDSSLTVFKNSAGVIFPEPIYRYQKRGWEEATNPVTLNTAGEAYHFFPDDARAVDGGIVFTRDLDVASLTSIWKPDATFPNDVIIEQTLVAKKDGYFSLASPALLTIPNEEVAWATVPGYFQSNTHQDDFISAYAYGHGIPEKPVLYRERTISTLTSIADLKKGASVAVTPAPGLARDPWRHDSNTQTDWSVALSHRSRRGDLTPTLYHPVLGEPQSKLSAGDTIRHSFRYSVIDGNWYSNLSHIINDIYHFKDGLALRSNKQSLSDRIRKMHAYLTDTKTSMWKIETFEGVRIGAQSYLGGVVGSDRDAMKNADYGAMWMLARASGDPFLKTQVLPYALNFKLKQQETKPGFFRGAAIGQYYLAKQKKYVEEWGEFIEPISLTYYIMLDIGNMLLFEPQNTELKERLKLGADLLLEWQQDDGSWVVAYDRESHEPLFRDIQDLRPTFYGLIVAYRLLKDDRYLQAARKGAEWLIANGVDKGHFIGVCGDARYAPDFATGQTAQAMLDLYELTQDEKYLDAAIQTAKLYTANIYTHPVPSEKTKLVKGVERKDWEIAQAGVSFEHGGLLGSAQRHGPIQLASHAGMFIRMFGLTQDSLFVDMARAAAVGRDAFVDSATNVASYYWDTMNRGAGPYPHHAWWQIGWITDYLMAEAELRTKGKIKFPRGFVAPKVGPHQTYGFEPGRIHDQAAELIIRDGLVTPSDPNCEFITALSPSGKQLYIVVMNAINKRLETAVHVDVSKITPRAKLKSVNLTDTKASVGKASEWSVALEGYGIQAYTVEIE